MVEKIDSIETISREIVNCRRCPRLVSYCRRVAREKKKAYRDQVYWGRPVPSIGASTARFLIIGLAPAAHGGNRTGRIFTGDASGDFLFKALYKFGFSNQPESVHAKDGLLLKDTYISAIIHCAPPQNKPLPDEILNCQDFLKRELKALTQLQAVLVLGKIAFTRYIHLMKKMGRIETNRKFKFIHGGAEQFGKKMPRLFSSYHPSQQNTRTGRLTQKMFDNVLAQIRAHLKS